MAKHQFNIQAVSTFIEDQSDPGQRRYVFAYTITIQNTGEVAARLLSRHWIITDSNNHVQEVQGDGVVGKQPLINPGEAFQYSSGSIIQTPIGTMHGSYQMLAEDGVYFDAPIPVFTLSSGQSTLH